MYRFGLISGPVPRGITSLTRRTMKRALSSSSCMYSRIRQVSLTTLGCSSRALIVPRGSEVFCCRRGATPHLAKVSVSLHRNNVVQYGTVAYSTSICTDKCVCGRRPCDTATKQGMSRALHSRTSKEELPSFRLSELENYFDQSKSTSSGASMGAKYSKNTSTAKFRNKDNSPHKGKRNERTEFRKKRVESKGRRIDRAPAAVPLRLKLQLKEKMQQIQALADRGKPREIIQMLNDEWWQQQDVRLDEYHYNALIKAFGRNKQHREAEEVVARMMANLCEMDKQNIMCEAKFDVSVEEGTPVGYTHAKSYADRTMAVPGIVKQGLTTGSESEMALTQAKSHTDGSVGTVEQGLVLENESKKAALQRELTEEVTQGEMKKEEQEVGQQKDDTKSHKDLFSLVRKFEQGEKEAQAQARVIDSEPRKAINIAGLGSIRVKPSIYTFNTLMNIFTRIENAQGVQRTLQNMQRASISPGMHTYGSILNMYRSTKDVHGAELVLDKVCELIEKEKKELKKELRAKTKTKHGAEAQKRRQKDTEQRLGVPQERQKGEMSIVIANAAMDIFAEAGDVKRMKTLKKRMEKEWNLAPDENTFNSFIKGFKAANEPQRAENVLKEMDLVGVRPSAVTFSLLINTYFEHDREDKVQSALREMETRGLTMDYPLFSLLFEHYRKRNDLEKAQKLIEWVESNNIFELKHAVYDKLLELAARQRVKRTPNDDRRIQEEGEKLLEQTQAILKHMQDKGKRVTRDTHQQVRRQQFELRRSSGERQGKRVRESERQGKQDKERNKDRDSQGDSAKGLRVHEVKTLGRVR